MNLCMSMGSRENKQNKVRTQLWDTLYIQGDGTEMLAQHTQVPPIQKLWQNIKQVSVTVLGMAAVEGGCICGWL